MTYQGKFVNGFPDGPGAATLRTGERLEGCFINGQLQGLGTAVRTDGTRLKGRFVDGKFEECEHASQSSMS